MHIVLPHQSRLRQAAIGALAAVACLLISAFCFHIRLSGLPDLLLGDPLMLLSRAFRDPQLGSSFRHVLATAATDVFSPYMLGQTIVAGALAGLLLPRLIHPGRPLALSLVFAAGLGLAGVLLVAAATATSLAFQFHFQRAETYRAARMVFVYHLSFSLPWALLISCLIAARLRRRAA